MHDPSTSCYHIALPIQSDHTLSKKKDTKTPIITITMTLSLQLHKCLLNIKRLHEVAAHSTTSIAITTKINVDGMIQMT
jgi:hypothetical protein